MPESYSIWPRPVSLRLVLYVKKLISLTSKPKS